MPTKMDVFFCSVQTSSLPLCRPMKTNASSAWMCGGVCVYKRDWMCTETESNGACFVYAAVAMDFSYEILLKVLPIEMVCVCVFFFLLFLYCVFQWTNNGGLFALTSYNREPYRFSYIVIQYDSLIWFIRLFIYLMGFNSIPIGSFMDKISHCFESNAIWKS